MCFKLVNDYSPRSIRLIRLNERDCDYCLVKEGSWKIGWTTNIDPINPLFSIFLVANHQLFENCRSWGEAKLSLSRQFGHTKSCFILKHSSIGNSYRKKNTQRNGLLNGYTAIPITSNIHIIRISKKVIATPARKKLWNSCNIKWKLFHVIITITNVFRFPPPPKKLATTQMCFWSWFPADHWNRCVSARKHLTSGPFFLIYKAKTSTFLPPEIASQTFFHKKSFSWKRRTWTFSCQTFHFGYVFLSDWFLRDSTMGIHHHFVTTIWETIF